MAKSMNKKRTPAGKSDKFGVAAVIGYGENILEGQFGFKDIASGKKSSPKSTELVEGMEIAVSNGGNPNRQTESR